MIPKSEEYHVVERWNSCTYEKKVLLVTKYQNMLGSVEKIVSNHYLTGAIHERIIKVSLEMIEEEAPDIKYLVALLLEERLGDFEYFYQNSIFLRGEPGDIIQLSPLNSNWADTGLMFYPRLSGIADRKKADRSRKLGFNGAFKYYDCFRTGYSPFKTVYYFWKSTKLQEKIDRNKCLRIAASPVTNHAELLKDELDTEEGVKLQIHGIQNKDEIQKKVLHLLESIWDRDYDLIMFPEVIGSSELYEAVQDFLRSKPIHHTLILLPTFYEHGHNRAVLLGPGGIDLFQQDKTTAFVMLNGEEKQKEFLVSDMEVGILLIRGLGSLALPICADLVNPDYAHLIYEEHQPDIVLCPSYSVGSGAFSDALLKGMSIQSLGLWLNTCAAQEISPENNYGFDHLGKIQLPHLRDSEKGLIHLTKECCGICRDDCYFHIEIEINHNKLKLRQWKHIFNRKEEDVDGKKDNTCT